jgi:ribose transport system substrate-binding protein
MVRTNAHRKVSNLARVAAIGSVVVVAVTLTACSSSGSSTPTAASSAAPSAISAAPATSGAATSSAAAPASSAAASSGAPMSSSAAPASSAVPSGSGGLAEAAANVAKYSALPTTLGITTPLPGPPVKGKTVVFLQCEVPQCADGGNGFRAAAAAVGWKTQTLTWKTTDPASLISDMQQALTLNPKPYAVSISGLPQAVWAPEVPAYQKAGVLLIPWSLGPVTINSTVIAEILSPQDIEFQGKLLADWFITDSGGTGKVLVQDVPQYPSIDEETVGFETEVKALCPGCTMTRLDVTGTQVASGGVTPAIVSALQRDSSIQYIMSADIALAAGLPAAMKAAGLSKVKILGGAATPIDEQNVRDGTDAVVMKNDLVIAGWLMIDVLLRKAAGVSFTPNDGGEPQQILTKATIPPANSTALVPANYPELFKTLWHVG